MIQFVEVVTSLHKTMRDFQHRHQFLQVVVPAVGVSHQNWGVLWKQVRDEFCIDFAQGHALMPAPVEDGTPGRRGGIHKRPAMMRMRLVPGPWLRNRFKTWTSQMSFQKDGERLSMMHALKLRVLMPVIWG